MTGKPTRPRGAARRLRFSVIPAAVAVASVANAAAEVVAGPVLGYVLPHEAAVFVDTAREALVTLDLIASGDAGRVLTRTILTEEGSAFRALFTLSGLHPDTRYTYHVSINGEPTTERLRGGFHTPPPPGADLRGRPLRIAMAGARQPLSGGSETSEDALPALAKMPVDAVFWTGGQQPLPPHATPTATAMHRKYRSLFEESALGTLFRNAAQYSVWSRHEVGEARSGKDWIFRGLAARAFCASVPRPVCGHPDFGGTASQARIGLAEFFLLDAVSFHSAAGSEAPRAFGEEQLAWLSRALAASEAPFRIIVAGRSLLTPVDREHTWQFARAERDRFLETLRSTDTPGVFFITGGAREGEMTRVTRPGTYPLHELTVGAVRLGEPPSGERPALNYDRMPGTRVAVAHFAVVEFSGGRGEPSMEITVFNASGESVWRDTFRASELRQREASQRRTP